jgi:hypothetical protein
MPENNNIQTPAAAAAEEYGSCSYLMMPLSVGRPSSLAAVEALATEEKEIVVFAQHDRRSARIPRQNNRNR